MTKLMIKIKRRVNKLWSKGNVVSRAHFATNKAEKLKHFKRKGFFKNRIEVKASKAKSFAVIRKAQRRAGQVVGTGLAVGGIAAGVHHYRKRRAARRTGY